MRKGFSESHAIATAVNVVKKGSSSGDQLNWPGVQRMGPKGRARYARAAASWLRKRARARATSEEAAHYIELAELADSHKDERGGLTAKGRRELPGDLKPGVRKPWSEMSRTEKGRWVSWALRHYAGPAKPLADDNGEPTRHAKQARAWGLPVPKTQDDVRRIVALARKRGKELRDTA